MTGAGDDVRLTCNVLMSKRTCWRQMNFYPASLVIAGTAPQQLSATKPARNPIVAKSQVSSESIPYHTEVFVRLFGSITDMVP